MLTKILKTCCKIFILSIRCRSEKVWRIFWICCSVNHVGSCSELSKIRREISEKWKCCLLLLKSSLRYITLHLFSICFFVFWMNQQGWPYLGMSKIKGRIYQRWKNCQTLHQSICFSTTSQLLSKIADHTNPKDNLKCKALSHNTWSCPYVKWSVDDIEIAHCNVSQLSKFWWALIWEYNYEVNSCWALCTKAENKWCKYSFKDGWSNLHLVL